MREPWLTMETIHGFRMDAKLPVTTPHDYVNQVSRLSLHDLMRDSSVV